MKPSRDTSWHKVGKWYNEKVGDRGSYYHEHVVLPGVVRLLKLNANSSLLDLGCGQGVLARQIPKNLKYVGIDAAASLITFAKKLDHNPNHQFLIGDVTQPLPITEKFSHAAIILALQNIEQPALAIKNSAEHLVPGGKLIIVLNHPAFRIPRQSSWGIDEQSKLQYRRENIYMSGLKIPITMHPGLERGGAAPLRSQLTWSFHEPISAYTKMLADNHFVIEQIEEWTSDKESVGKAGRMENRSRAEFPLFLAIQARLDR
ncbi:MAG: class I SAM-dependent methyltransferase [Candidatus Gottesmanbacteria bacterium]|nr:class I SAM-dependent methyltransferase [Candidatus Gottesmanbacteria bacterium]